MEEASVSFEVLRLHAAARGGEPDEIRDALACGVAADAPDAQGATALMWASAFFHTRAVVVLLKAGARVDNRDSQGRTAIDWSVGGHALAEKELLARASQSRMETLGVSRVAHTEQAARPIARPRPAPESRRWRTP